MPRKEKHSKLARIVPVTDKGKRIRVDDETLDSFIKLNKKIQKGLKQMKNSKRIKEQDKAYDKVWNLLHDFDVSFGMI